MSKDDVNPSIPPVVDGSVEQPKNALTLAQELIRKLDEESNKMLEHISAEQKLRNEVQPELGGQKREEWERLRQLAAEEQNPDKLKELVNESATGGKPGNLDEFLAGSA